MKNKKNNYKNSNQIKKYKMKLDKKIKKYLLMIIIQIKNKYQKFILKFIKTGL